MLNLVSKISLDKLRGGGEGLRRQRFLNIRRWISLNKFLIKGKSTSSNTTLSNKWDSLRLWNEVPLVLMELLRKEAALSTSGLVRELAKEGLCTQSHTH